VKASVFIGTSVDGFIARANGDLDFLPPGGGEPHGYEEFMATVDVLVIGRKTYETVLNFDSSLGQRRVVGVRIAGIGPAFVRSTSAAVRPSPLVSIVELCVIVFGVSCSVAIVPLCGASSRHGTLGPFGLANAHSRSRITSGCTRRRRAGLLV
jgi:hypothetical protein